VRTFSRRVPRPSFANATDVTGEGSGVRKRRGGAFVSVCALPTPQARHCEERSDEAIQNLDAALDCFASLAVTKE
jgi:hypothetical protein